MVGPLAIPAYLIARCLRACGMPYIRGTYKEAARTGEAFVQFCFVCRVCKHPHRKFGHQSHRFSQRPDLQRRNWGAKISGTGPNKRGTCRTNAAACAEGHELLLRTSVSGQPPASTKPVEGAAGCVARQHIDLQDGAQYGIGNIVQSGPPDWTATKHSSVTDDQQRILQGGRTGRGAVPSRLHRCLSILTRQRRTARSAGSERFDANIVHPATARPLGARVNHGKGPPTPT